MTRTITDILATILLSLTALGSLSAQQSTPQHHHYKLVDLGTFGGPNGFLYGFTVPVNSRGMVSGCSDSLVLDPNFATQNPYFGGDPYIQVAYERVNGVRRKFCTNPDSIPFSTISSVATRLRFIRCGDAMQ